MQDQKQNRVSPDFLGRNDHQADATATKAQEVEEYSAFRTHVNDACVSLAPDESGLQTALPAVSRQRSPAGMFIFFDPRVLKRPKYVA